MQMFETFNTMPRFGSHGGRGKSFSGCQGANEYVQLYTPRKLLQENHLRGEKFLKLKSKKTFKNNGIKLLTTPNVNVIARSTQRGTHK